ncbi:MAG: VCBS repeat-containing protein [Planctomycetota bacterium]
MTIFLALTAALALQAPTADGSAAPRAEVSTTEASFVSPGLVETRIALQNDGSRLALRDLDGDGGSELLRLDKVGVAVRALGQDGAFSEAEALLPWPGKRVAWDLVDLDGDGRIELVTVTDGRRVELRNWTASGGPAGAWNEPTLLLEELCYLPWGVTRVGLARDVDGDGRADLVLPGAGIFRIRRNLGVGLDEESGGDAATGAGAGGPATPRLRFEAPIEVAFEPEVELDLGEPERLSSAFAQHVEVPWFRVEDIDGDGALDLVSETTDRDAIHLARPTISTQPTWVLDLVALRGAQGGATIDLDDLLSFVSGTAQWRVADLDGVPPNDLVLGAEGTFKLYLGGAATGPRDRADQVLKASGNVLYFFLRDVLGDGKPDLQIARGERLSLAKLLRFLLLPGRIEFELFTYENLGVEFDRKPTRRSTLALRVPRLLGFLDDVEQLSDELEKQWDIPARRIDWDGDGANDDVLDQRGGRLVVVRDCAPGKQRWEDLPATDMDGLVERVILEDLDRAGNGGESVIDIGEIDRFAMAPGAALRDLAANREAVVEAALSGVTKERALRGIDIDGDGRIDLVASGRDEKNVWRVQIFVRR